MNEKKYRSDTEHTQSNSHTLRPPSVVTGLSQLTTTYFLFLGLSFLVCSTSFATTNAIPEASKFELNTTIRSFNETTTLAEELWANLTVRFVNLYEKGEYSTALTVAERAYDIAINNFGINDVNTADTLLKLGIINQTLGKFTVAEDHLLGSLVILEDQLSPDHPDVAVTATNLGNVYFDMKRFKDSEKYHKIALRIRENAFGNTNPVVAQSSYNLAILYEQEKKYKKAESLYLDAIATWSTSVGPTHPYIGNALGGLTNLYTSQEKYQDAVNILLHTVSYKKAIFGEEHEEVAQTLINLGTAYIEQDKFASAGDAYEEALNIAQNLLNSSDPQLALLMYTLANIYHMQARMDASATATTTVSATTDNTGIISEKISDTDESASVGAQDDSEVANTTALFNQALPLYKKAVEILDGEQTKNWSTLDVVLTELVMVYKAIGNNDMAAATELRISTH